MPASTRSRHRSLKRWLAVVDSRLESDAGPDSENSSLQFQSLAEALQAWQETPISAAPAIIQIADNCIHPLDGFDITLAGGQQLVIEAAEGMRPCVRGHNEHHSRWTGYPHDPKRPDARCGR